MNILFLLIIVTGTCCCLGAQEPMIHHCINDKVSLGQLLHVIFDNINMLLGPTVTERHVTY